MSNDATWKMATKFIHAGVEPDQYRRDNDDRFTKHQLTCRKRGKNKGYEYARKTLRALLKKKQMAIIENGKFGLAFSGSVAATDAVIKIAATGDEVIAETICMAALTGFLQKCLKFGIKFHYVNMNDANNIASLINHKYKIDLG